MASLAACGGTTGSLTLPAGTFTVAKAFVPPTSSGDFVNVEIPVSGGCGGPYTVSVISGDLPPGLSIDTSRTSADDPGRHHIVGYVMEDGHFQSRLEIVDTGCTPYQAAIVELDWQVQVGALAIVDANPGLVAPEDLTDGAKYTDVPGLPVTIFGQTASIDLIVAGGVGPYECAVIDDPNDLEDGPLPLGVSMPSGSCSLIGTPNEILSSGRPFRITLEATDSLGQKTQRTVQWSIITPPLVLVTDSLTDAQAGVFYSDFIQVASGVPPFKFELVDEIPSVSNEDFTYVSGQPPTFPSPSGFTVDIDGVASNRLTADGGASGGSTATYPAPGAIGPFGPLPPEGIYLEDSVPTGGSVPLTGKARRGGLYNLFAHAYSSIVPNARGQHVFGAFTLNVLPADPMQIDPSITVQGTLPATEPYSSLPELEVGFAYNPDGGAAGLQLSGLGGVTRDEHTDAPHASQRMLDLSGPADTFEWAVDWDPIGKGTAQIPGVEITTPGVLWTFDESLLIRQGPQVIELEMTDFQIPPQSQTALCTVSVGPDVVILTHSTQNWTGIYNYYSYSTRHEPNDNQVLVRKFIAPSAGSPTMGPLDAGDMTPGTSVPGPADLAGATNPIGALLSGATGGDNDLDLLRCTINPTGWWDDTFGLNVNGARPFQHADPNSSYPIYGQTGPYYYRHANWQPSCSSVDLPDVDGVAEDRVNGIYTDGGRLYHFESDNRFGMFIIRSDASIYVPFAMEKSSSAGEGGFGDGIFETKSDGQQNGLLRTVQMTVSPNGRIGAMKLKQTPTNRLETSANSRILLVSLTGEPLWNGETWRIVDPGGAATGSTSGRYLAANSMTLTDTNLYFLFSTQTSTYLQSWSSYYIMRYGVFSGDSGAHLLPRDGGSTVNWQQPNVPIQTVFQHWYLNPYRESSTTYGSWPYHRYWGEHGANFIENGLAPLPFRVSRNGMACAILAGPNSTSSLSTTVYRSYLWVDYDGSGARQATSSLRHATAGGSRGYALATGPNEYAMWGRYTGPTTGLEISDDGLRVAFTYTDYTGSFYASASGTSSSHTVMRYRQDIVCASSTGATPWVSSIVEKEVTSSAFGGSHRWRFGALVFTADNDGLVFWGGAPAYQSNNSSYSYNHSSHFHGTMYSCANLDSTTQQVKSTLTSSEGGATSSITTYSSSSPFNPSGTSGLNTRFGTLQPFGGFLSKNRNFLYICDYSAVTTSSNGGCELIGVNVSTLSSGSINGHTNGQGFMLDNWPNRRGFMGNYLSYPGYAMYYSYGYAPQGHQGGSRQMMARDTGAVFWGAHWQYAGPYQTTSSTFGGPVVPTYAYGAYGYGGTGIYGFDADRGGEVAALHHSSWTANSTGVQERLHYLDVSDDGSKLAYVTSAYYYYSYYTRERVMLISDISFATADGSIHPGFNRTQDAQRLETSQGRAGESMALIPGGTDVYYAFKGGASNETTLEMVKARIEAGTSVSDKTVYSGITGRMNVLFAGR